MVKNPPANARDAGSIPGQGRSPGEGNGNPLIHNTKLIKSCLEGEARCHHDSGRYGACGSKMYNHMPFIIFI